MKEIFKEFEEFTKIITIYREKVTQIVKLQTFESVDDTHEESMTMDPDLSIN